MIEGNSVSFSSTPGGTTASARLRVDYTKIAQPRMFQSSVQHATAHMNNDIVILSHSGYG